jgi:hypothetical protein
MFSFSSLMSMPDEEFDELGEDELALLTSLVREVERISWSHQKPTTKMIFPQNLTILGTD